MCIYNNYFWWKLIISKNDTSIKQSGLHKLKVIINALSVL